MNKNYIPGQQVAMKILRETDLGFVASIDEKDEGLLYHDEIFEHLDIGQELPGYIKKVREDGQIDLLLQPFGNLGTQEWSERILSVLKDHKGFLPITAKTPPKEIYDLFGLSKKKYKIALGHLYKKRLVTIDESGIRLMEVK